jgi:hypothetical protein
MAADVLSYNAIQAVNQELRAHSVGLSSAISMRLGGGNTGDTDEAKAQFLCTTSAQEAFLWCMIPKEPADGSSWTSGFKVCDQTGYYRCGCNCTWSVPSGVTCARFQIWGAGGPSGSGCCCATSPMGGSGAYASVIMPVSSGQSFTMCAGCAYCCYHYSGDSNIDGESSYVQGPGLTNFCAMGGEGGIQCERKTRAEWAGGFGCTGMDCFINSTGDWCLMLGGCICNSGTQICYPDGIVYTSVGRPYWANRYRLPTVRSCKQAFGSASDGQVYTLNGNYGSVGISESWSHCGQYQSIYGWLGCCDAPMCYTSIYTGGCCRQAQYGYRQMPAMGGTFGFKCGGYTSYDPYGDAGRMGMVCVSYK